MREGKQAEVVDDSFPPHLSRQNFEEDMLASLRKRAANP